MWYEVLDCWKPIGYGKPTDLAFKWRAGEYPSDATVGGVVCAHESANVEEIRVAVEAAAQVEFEKAALVRLVGCWEVSDDPQTI